MRVVIVGAGPAGTTIVETLREEGWSGEIVLLSAEPHPPYSPPAMVEYLLTGREVHLWKGRDFAERMGVEWLPGARVRALDPKGRQVIIEGGREIAYDRLVLAPGSRLWAPITGAEKPGVYDFKLLTTAEEVVARVRRGEARRAVIVGAGFIGVEVAILLRRLGADVCVVEMAPQVMPRVLDPEVAEIVQRTLVALGVDVQLRTEGAAFLGEPRAEAVQLRDGRLLYADVLVAATGVKPNVDFLRGSGLDASWGVWVDEQLATNVPGIWAAGDVAETVDRVTGERYVHAIFPNAVAQGRVVAHNLLGHRVRYEGADQMNSLKHLGLPVMAVGHPRGDEVLRVRRGDRLRKLFLRDGRLVGFQLAGDVSAAGILHSLLDRRTDVRPLRPWLLDPAFGMGALVELAARPDAGGVP